MITLPNRKTVNRLCAVLCAVTLALAPLVRAQTGAPSITNAEKPTDVRRLEIIEDLSESLANQLLELSVATHDKNADLTSEFFPVRFQATLFPCEPKPSKQMVKWVHERAWSVPQAQQARIVKTGGQTSNQPTQNQSTQDNKQNSTTPTATTATGANASTKPSPFGAMQAMTRLDFMREWTLFLNHFAEIEDARFKVKEASFDETANSVSGAEQPTAVPGATGKARVAFYVIGRNTEGKREWARGTVNVTVKYVARGDVDSDANKNAKQRAADNSLINSSSEAQIVKTSFASNNASDTKEYARGRWQFETWNLASFDSLVAEKDIFSEVAVPTGVELKLPSYSGGFTWHGAAAADFDKDGWVDLFVTAPDKNLLYLNDKRGKFLESSSKTGVQFAATGVAPLTFDYDNDGDSDLFISAVGSSQILLQNQLKESGKLEFIDVSNEAGVALPAIGFSAIAGDVNGDGFLDVYVCGYNRYGQVTPDSWFRAKNGTPNLLFINQGDGTFKEEARKWGVEDSRWSYAAAFADTDEDGRLDLYVANDFGEKALYINKGDRFVDEASKRGVLDPGNGMGVSFGDYNNDGLLDLHASNMSSTAGNRILARLFPTQNAGNNVLKKLAAGNNLFENQGKGFYKDVTAEVGGFSGGWAWGGGFIDFDNDGWEDIFTPNGFISGKSMKDT